MEKPKYAFPRKTQLIVVWRNATESHRDREIIRIFVRIVVEVKSVAALLSVHEAQLLTYLRLANCPVGLLINFNVRRLMDGVQRKVNPRFKSESGVQPTN